MAVKEPNEDREVDRRRRIPMSKEPQSSVLMQLQDEREMLRWTPLFLPPLLLEAPRETTDLLCLREGDGRPGLVNPEASKWKDRASRGMRSPEYRVP